MAVREGLAAPDFALQGSDGKTHTLKDYKGKTLVLYFYPKDDTPGCTKEACGFRDSHEDLSSSDVVVLGVSRDSFVAHGRFIAKYKLPFVLLSDPEAKVTKKYGAWGKKTLYGKPVQGVIRSTVVIGPDGKVLKHWSKVDDAARHPLDVLAFVSKAAPVLQ